MMTRPMPGWSFKVARSTEINTSICPVRRSWALKLLPDTRPAYGSYLSQSISLVAPLNTPENVSSVRLMKGPSASRTNLLVEALWMLSQPLAERRLRLRHEFVQRLERALAVVLWGEDDMAENAGEELL